jgi:hypothetical protein
MAGNQVCAVSGLRTKFGERRLTTVAGTLCTKNPPTDGAPLRKLKHRLIRLYAKRCPPKDAVGVKWPLLRHERPFGLPEQFVLVDGWSLVAGSLVQSYGG